jgi:hypothetical protein
MTNTAETSFARLARLVQLRGLAEVAPYQGGETPTLDVAGSTFVRLLDGAVAELHCPVDQKVLLMEISPDIFFETDRLVGRDAVLVRLDRIDDEELGLKLEDAWAFRRQST